MKKYLLICCLLIVLCLGLVSYYVPPTLRIAQIVTVNCISDAVFRKLSDETNWNKWSDNQLSASITKKNTNAFEITMLNHGLELKSYVHLISIPVNNTVIKWETTLETGGNPFTQLFSYWKALAIKKNMQLTLQSLGTYLSRFESVYGFRLQESSITDTLLVTSKFISKGYPGTSIIYNQIEKLKKISGSKGVSITGNPLININNISSSDYQVMVALPVNKLFSSGDSVIAKRMIPGKFIVAEVKGGSYQVMNMLEQIKLYAQDYGRSPVAIPFEYLLTDRQQEPDSNKWVTKLYLPVY